MPILFNFFLCIIFKELIKPPGTWLESYEVKVTIFFCFFATSMAYRNSQAKDQTQATAMTTPNL